MTAGISKDPVLTLLAQHVEIVEFLRASDRVPEATKLLQDVVKILILSGASYFEHRVLNAIMAMSDSIGDERASTLIRTKAVKRQYHTFFEWEKCKMGAFRTLFGDEFSDALRKWEAGPENGGLCVRAFLEIGRERNLIIHSNFAVYSPAGDLVDWQVRYEDAAKFVVKVESLLSAPAPKDESGSTATVARGL